MTIKFLTVDDCELAQDLLSEADVLFCVWEDDEINLESEDGLQYLSKITYITVG